MHALGGLVGVGESQHILEPAAGKIAAGRQARGKEEDCEPALAHKFACCMDGMLPPQACPAAAALLTPPLHVPPPHPTPLQRLYQYIDGANHAAVKIPMTAPVRTLIRWGRWRRPWLLCSRGGRRRAARGWLGAGIRSRQDCAGRWAAWGCMGLQMGRFWKGRRWAACCARQGGEPCRRPAVAACV